MKRLYEDRSFSAAGRSVIEAAEVICDEYARQGYNLTLRQLYYQFIATDAFPDKRRYWWDDESRRWVHDPAGSNRNSTKNAEPNYDWLGKLISDARVAGLIDWAHITDRTRSAAGGDGGYASPADMIRSTADSYVISRWDGQPEYIEVWVEKEALADVISRPCNRWNVRYLACKGYVSQSEMHKAARRLARYESALRRTTVIYLGDHDPSGIDMTRDVQDRLRMFGSRARVERIALNMPQVEELNPPPSPAKITDSRAKAYIERFGDDSWELDALDPATLDRLVEDTITPRINMGLWNAREEQEGRERRILTALTDNWEDVEDFMRQENMVIGDEDEDDGSGA